MKSLFAEAFFIAQKLLTMIWLILKGEMKDEKEKTISSYKSS